jgi:phage terminase large subunit-like protein
VKVHRAGRSARRCCLHAITRYQPQADKVMRMHAQTAMIENGFVHLPREAGWRAEYLHELTVFPGGKHDDQVDGIAIGFGAQMLVRDRWSLLSRRSAYRSFYSILACRRCVTS